MLNKLKPGSLFFRLLAANLLVVLTTLIAVSYSFSYLAEDYFFSAREWELTSQARKVAEVLGKELQFGTQHETKKVANALAASMDVKIRVIDPTSEPQQEQTIVATPEGEEEDTQIGLEPYEIDHVLQGDTLSKKVMGPGMQRFLVAMPVFREYTSEDEGGVLEEILGDEEPGELAPGEEVNEGDGGEEVIGVITVSAPLSGIEATVAHLSRLTTYSGIFAAAIAGILALSLSKTISKPLRQMTRSARELVKGNFQSRIEVTPSGEMGELAETFNQAVDEIEKTMDEQKRLQQLRQYLLASVSHEFRAPLTSIQGFAEAMLDGFVEDEEDREQYLKVILDNTNYLKRLVNDLLELSSIESGHVELRWEKISPGSLLERVFQSVAPKAADKNIGITYGCAAELEYIWGDKDRLYQVLLNLMENAVSYTPEGGRVALYAGKEGEEAVFTAADSGPGIPADDIPFIWEKFYKVDKARTRADKGKGLGLAIVKELVEKHSGRVSVESEPGAGSTFYVTLPLTPPELKYDEAGSDGS